MQLWKRGENGFDLWTPPRGSVPVALDPEEGWVWTLNGSRTEGFRINAELPGSDENTYAFDLGNAEITQVVASHRHAVVATAAEARLLAIGTGGIKEVGRWLATSVIDRSQGAVVLNEPGMSLRLIDLNGGHVHELPAATVGVESFERIDGELVGVLKLRDERLACVQIHLNGIRILNERGNCVRVNARPQRYIVYADGEHYYARLFTTGWEVHTEQSLGAIRESKIDGNVIQFSIGNKWKPFCMRSTGVHLLPPSNQRVIACTDRHHITLTLSPELRCELWDSNSNQVLIRNPGILQFASTNAQESYYIAYANPLPPAFSSLHDLNRPERYSILTGPYISNSEARNYPREFGLLLMKDGQMVWLGNDSHRDRMPIVNGG
ncbi:MAG: hypothetical protein AB7G93_07205 [Bdellovibrionales bacterium]